MGLSLIHICPISQYDLSGIDKIDRKHCCYNLPCIIIYIPFNRFHLPSDQPYNDFIITGHGSDFLIVRLILSSSFLFLPGGRLKIMLYNFKYLS